MTTNAEKPDWDIRIELIGPEKARAYRKKSDNWRNESESWSKTLADRMRKGEWRNNAVPILLNREGELIDGQNRMKAIELSGQSKYFLVVRNAVGSSTTGEVRPRSLAQHLQKIGIKYYTTHATLVRIMIQYMSHGGIGVYKSSPTINAQLEVFETLKQQGSFYYVEMAAKMPEVAPVGMLASLLFLFAKIDQELAEKFAEGLRDGNYPVGDPIMLLRQKLLGANAIDRRRWKGQTGSREWAALAIKAWNAWRSGTSVKRLHWRAVGPSAEPFPDIL